jgi:hypothetical protein
MRKHRIETRQYKMGPVTLRTLKTCGFRQRIDRISAKVSAACDVWLAKKALEEARVLHPWKNTWV